MEYYQNFKTRVLPKVKFYFKFQYLLLLLKIDVKHIKKKLKIVIISYFCVKFHIEFSVQKILIELY